MGFFSASQLLVQNATDPDEARKVLPQDGWINLLQYIEGPFAFGVGVPAIAGGVLKAILDIAAGPTLEVLKCRQRVLVQRLFEVLAQGVSIRNDPRLHAGGHEQNLIVLRAASFHCEG